MIGKAKNPRAFKKVKIPLDYANSKNAWMTELMFKNWFEKSFVKQVKRYLRENNLSTKALLPVDNATCHPKLLADIDKNICVMFLPPNCTAGIQPMDQNVIRILNMNYRKSCLSIFFIQFNKFNGYFKKLFFEKRGLSGIKCLGYCGRRRP